MQTAGRKFMGSRTVKSLALLYGTVIIICGCGKQERTLEEIELERRTLPTVFITQESRTHVTAPLNQGVVVHEPTGELAYPAFACGNPNCPGREGDQPFLFIQTDPTLSVGPNNELVRGPPKGAFNMPVCPACLAVRDLENETLQEQAQYMRWAEEYLPPESAAREAELDEEYQRVYEKSGRRVGGQ